MKIAVTGAGGLLGWHVAARLHAVNCAARFRKEAAPHDLVTLTHAAFQDDAQLAAALTGADAVLHFAGVNRGTEAEVRDGNPAIALRLAETCAALRVRPHIVYANSTPCQTRHRLWQLQTPAAEILAGIGGGLTDMILPHIFGEGARPRYNNVTATFIEAVIAGQSPQIDPNGKVHLLHAGAAAQIAMDATLSRHRGELAPEPRTTEVPWLFETLQRFHARLHGQPFP